MSPLKPDQFYHASGDLEGRIAVALAKLALVGRRALDRQAAGGSISAIQSLVLERLARLGPAQVGRLAAQLAVTAPTISDSVAALERKGLVRRVAVAGDARGVEVRLTQKGRRVAATQGDWPEVFESAVAELMPQEKAVLLSLLSRIITELVEEGVVREARICTTCEYFRPYVHDDAGRPHHCGLVDLPLADEHLRVDCPDHSPTPPEALRTRLRVLRGGGGQAGRLPSAHGEDDSKKRRRR